MSEDKDGVPQWYLIKHERGKVIKSLCSGCRSGDRVLGTSDDP